MLNSLAARLIALVAGLVTLALLASTFASLRAANANVATLVREELSVLEGVARFALERQGQALRERVALVTADYALKEAMASGDQATALSALANHGGRMSADFAVLLDRDGEVLLSSVPRETLEAVIPRILADSAQSGEPLLLPVNAQITRLVARPVEAPQLLGWIVLGETLDRETLESLRTLTSAEVSLIVRQQNAERLVATTIPEFESEGFELALGSEDWLSQRIDLSPSDDAQISLLLSLSLSQALAAYDPLRLQLVIIGAIALVLAIAVSLGAAGYLTRPIARMVDTAQRISEGDYTHPVAIRSGTELDHLGQALSFMQSTVAEREERIQYQAEHDLLTGLPNRNHLYNFHERFLAENPPRSAFAVVLMALEDLQQLQDLYGADFSDHVLRDTARRIVANLRAGDEAGRVGDRQILLFLPGVRPQQLSELLELVRRERGQPLVVEGIPVTVELRLGIAFSPDHGVAFDDLQRRALLALQAARARASDHAVYELGQDERHLRQISIAGRIEEALKEHSFSLLYQPKYSLVDERVTGVEALLRWTDRELGPVYPDEFIPIAEQTGLITALTRWVLSEALARLSEWHEADRSLGMSINLSGIDVLDRSFIAELENAVRAALIPPESLTLEITETSMMEDIDEARVNLERLRTLGLRISIDDYGTGFSSLGQLRSLPVRELKLDRSLVAEIDTQEADRRIVASTIDMAHHLGLVVVAEGVETPTILAELRAMGCDIIQGYLLAKPLSAPDLLALIDGGVSLGQAARLGETA